MLILDLQMTQLDSLSVCKMLKSDRQTKYMGILMFTGYDGDDNLDRARVGLPMIA